MRYEFGEFVLDTDRQTLARSGEPGIPLAGKAYDTLLYLVTHPGEALDKDRLLAALWPGTVVEENSLTQVISTLRPLLGEVRGEHRYILTLPRKGYRFVAPVSTAGPELVATAPANGAAPPVTGGGRRRLIVAAGMVVLLVALGVATTYLYRRSTAAIHSIAILPFKPLVPADRDPALELGMADALIGELGRGGGRQVAPLSSVRRFGGLDQDPIEAGRLLKVDAVLEGSIQRQGDRLRISARLLRVADAQQLWTQAFDQTFTGIFEVQDTLAQRIAAALPASGAPATPAAARGTQNPEAFARYASGRFAFLRLTETSLGQALELYQQALTLDPDYALAYTGLADCYALLSVLGAHDPRTFLPQARQAADKALALDPQLAAAYTARGQIRSIYDHDWRGGLADFDHAIELDPRYASAYFYRGLVYGGQGRYEPSRLQFDKAQRLEPFVLARPSAAALMLLYQHRYDEGIAALRQILALDERFDLARGFLVRLLIAKGDAAAALHEIEGRELITQGSRGFRAESLAIAGRRAEAQRELERVLALAKQQYVPAYDIAMIYAAFQDADNTLLWMGRAYEDRSTLMGAMGQEPLLDFLHQDPRFVEYVSRYEMPHDASTP